MSENIESVVENPQMAQDVTPIEKEAAFAEESERSLESALNGLFEKNKQEEKPNEKEQAPAAINETKDQTPNAQVQKDAEPVDKGEAKAETRSKVELPDPESISDTPTKGGTGKSSENWKAMRSHYKEAHARIQEREREIEALKKQIAEKVEGGSKEVEKYKQELQELSKYRAMVDIQADPEFIEKFDKPIQESEKSIRSMIRAKLKESGGKEELADQVNPMNPEMMQLIIDKIAEKNKFDARKLERKVEDYLNLHDKRNETLAEHKENYQKTLEEKKKQAFSRGAEEEGRMLKHFDTLAKTQDEAKNPRFPFLTKREIPSGANSAQTEQIEEHNRMVDVATKKVNEVMRMNGPEQRAEIAVAAVSSQYLSAQNENLRKENQSLRDEIKKLSSVTEETPKSKVRNDKGQFQKTSDDEVASTDDALRSHFGR